MHDNQTTKKISDYSENTQSGFRRNSKPMNNILPRSAMYWNRWKTGAVEKLHLH